MSVASGARGDAGGGLRELLTADWKAWLNLYPEVGTAFGYPGMNDRWTDDSPAGVVARVRFLSECRERLGRFDPAALGPADRLSYDLYRESIEEAVEGQAFGFEPFPFQLGQPRCLWMPLNQMEGIHQSAVDFLNLQPRSSPQDFADLLARLRRLPAAVDQQIGLLRAGVARGFTPPRVCLECVPGQLDRLRTDVPLESAILTSFHDLPATLTAGERDRLVAEATAVYRDEIAPALLRLREYVAGEYLAACRTTVACGDLPDGAARYRYLVAQQTTLPTSPEQVHALGVSEVERIQGNMLQVKDRSAFAGDFAAFNTFLRTDDRFYYSHPEELIAGYRAIAKQIDPETPRLFGRLPRLPYGVQPIPSFRAPNSPTAYYWAGSTAAGRPGVFYANTYDLRARPRWEMESLVIHEAVPGHHLQLALSEELDELPEFRRYTGPTAFVEGWAHYTESLGEEIGLYRDPYSKYGQLCSEMWRAIRLVVDTGIHAFGWSRERAMQYFRDHTGKSDQDIEAEVNRYIVWPGQALAYRVGALKIRELRTRAEQRLGGRFDVRTFHDRVLDSGMISLARLERRIDEWISTVGPDAAA